MFFNLNKSLKFSIFFVVLLLQQSVVATAETERTVPWGEMEELEVQTISRSQFGSLTNLYEPKISSSLIEHVMKDPDKLIHRDFRIPSDLKAAVSFWMKIYTEFSTKQVVVFDSHHLDLIYDVIDLRKEEELRSDVNPRETIQHTMDNFKNALLALAANPEPQNPTREQKLILKRIRQQKLSVSFSELAKGLKSQRGQRDNVIVGMIAAERFLPKMEMIFQHMGIPTELTRLSLVESSFNVRAQSRVGALGVWQFMESSGKKYLKIDRTNQIDERLSALKSTLAAGKLLKENYNYLGNWVLAIISYNHGMKNLPVLSEGDVPFSKLSYLFDPSGDSPPLGWASRNYYSEFLAMVYAESYRKVFYGELSNGSPVPVAFRQLERRQTGLSVALKYGIPLQDFRLFNADIVDLHRVLPKGFWVAVPGETDDLAELIDSILHQSKAKS